MLKLKMDLSDFGIHPDFGLWMHNYACLQAFWSGFKIDNFPKSAILMGLLGRTATINPLQLLILTCCHSNC